MKPYYIQFTKEMKKDYTLLVPTMLPMHFRLIISVLETYGYKADLLTESGPEIPETGLKYVQRHLLSRVAGDRSVYSCSAKRQV